MFQLYVVRPIMELRIYVGEGAGEPSGVWMHAHQVGGVTAEHIGGAGAEK